MQQFCAAFFILLCLLGCHERSDWKRSATVQRSAYNYPAIQVDSVPPGEDADVVLIERQAYEQASDRFLQMDILRRTAWGRLAEVLGDGALSKDIQTVAVGLRKSIERSDERMRREQPEIYRLFEAYARGVNRYLAEQSDDSRLLRLYRSITHHASYRPELWFPSDSVAVGDTVLFYLSSDLQAKLMYGSLVTAFQKAGKADQFASVFDWRPLYNVSILPPVIAAPPPNRSSRQSATDLGTCQELGFPFSPCRGRDGVGSNNWVVAPEFSGNGVTYLANDPHLPLTFPTTFYEIALDNHRAGGKFNRVRGLNVPGIPGVSLFGHNAFVAWGTTNQPANVDDIYVEQFDAAKEAVRFRGKWVPLEAEPITLQSRQSDGGLVLTTLHLKWAPHHGPVFSDYLLADRKGPVLTYRWTGHRGTLEGAALLKLNWATSPAEIRNALNLIEALPQNIVYADKKGTIGYYSHASYPIRRYLSKAIPPYVPVPGTGETEWELNFREEIPALENPYEGFIVTANNDPFGYSFAPDFSNFRDTFGYSYSSGARAARIVDRLRAERGKLNRQKIEAIQFDHTDLSLMKFQSLLKQTTKAVGPLEGKANELRESILRWNGEMDRAQVDGHRTFRWVQSLIRRYFAPTAEVIGTSLTDQLLGRVDGFVLSTVGMKTAYHRLSDRPDPTVVRESLLQTVDGLEQKNLWDVRWGEVHRFAYASPLGKLLPSIAELPMERDGSSETVDVAGATFGPNFRLVMEIPKEGEIVGDNVISGGNYDPMVSESWKTELQRWLKGEHRALTPFVD